MNLQKYYQNHIQIGCDKQIKFLPKEVVELKGKKDLATYTGYKDDHTKLKNHIFLPTDGSGFDITIFEEGAVIEIECCYSESDTKTALSLEEVVNKHNFTRECFSNHLKGK